MNCSKKKPTCYYYYGQYGMYYQHLEEVDEEIKKSSQWLGMAGSKDSIEALIMDTSLWWKGRVKD